jgi:hypothetical protein
MVHCAVAELDRITPLAVIIARTPADELDDLEPAALLEREDLMPPLPDDDQP